jgi:hypothetical protein
MIDLINVPLARGGSVVLLIKNIGGAITNRDNPDYTDVYSAPFIDPVTIDMDIDQFGEIWFSALCEDMDSIDDYITHTAMAMH